MAASQEQKVDFLLKKIGYVASKTGIAEDESSLSGTKKAPFGEAIPSPLVVPSTSVWADSSFIPSTPPGASTAYVEVYLSGTSGHRMTVDSTVSGNRTFIAHSTYNNSSSAILGDWIDTSFGADYIIKVYKGDPNSGGVQLSAAGSGSNDTWFFDYSSGVLNFNGTQVPSGVTSSNIYIVGYRYIGTKGVQFPAGVTTATSLSVSGISTFNNDVLFTGTNYNVLWNKSDDELEFADNAKVTFGDGADLKIYHDGSNSYVEDAGVGALIMKGSTIRFRSTTNENIISASQNGSVDLYYDNSKKFETTSYGTYITGIASATTLSTGPVGTGINIGVGSITGPAEIIIDPAGVGDNTGTVRIAGDLQVDGTTTTLDTVVTEVDKLEVAANNTTVGVAITQSGTGDILNLYDGSTEVFSVEDGGRIVATATNSVIPFLYANYSDLPSASTYHGAFAHVHATGKAYFAHAGNWIEIVSKETSGTVGTGTETYSVGAATFAGDVSIADKIVHTGDTDTAIRFPANNTFAIETNGSERLRVTSTGAVGIGTDAPAQKLHILADGSPVILLEDGNGTDQTFTRYKSSAHNWAVGADHQDGSFVINKSTNLRTGIPELYIKSDGNVGIGTDDPQSILHISSGTSGDATLILEADTDNNNEADNPNIIFRQDGGLNLGAIGMNRTNSSSVGPSNQLYFAASSADAAIVFATGHANGYTNASERLRITHDGLVGIATATPRQTLDVDGGVHIQENLNVVGIATFQSHVHLGDNDQLRLGDGDDLKIFHDGTDSSITNHTGRLIIRNNTNNEDINIQTDNGSGGVTSYIRCDGSDGSVILSHYGNTKLETKSTGIEVTGLTDTDTLTTGNTIFTGTVSAGSSTGTDGQYLISTGVGVSWTTLPTARTTTTITAAEDQTSFPFNYNVGFVDVFYNGVKLANTEFTASNGTAVVLNDVAYAGDVVELISYATAAAGGGGGGASNLNDLADVTITGSPVIGETLTHNGSKFVNDLTTTTTTTATTQVSILSLDLSVYRSVEYQIQVTEGSKYHTTKILAIHNGTAAVHNEFGTLSIGTVPATFDVDISGSNMRLLATPASSNSTVFKVKFTGIKV